MNRFDYLAPESLEAALAEVSCREGLTLLAGGTAITPLLKCGARKPFCLLDLGRIQDLKRVATGEDGLYLGSMVPLVEVVENPVIRQHLPALSESARRVASPQIRNQGTVGGNLLQERRCHYFNQSESWRGNISPCLQLGGDVCHQVPSSKTCRAIYYSDLAPVLLAFDAVAEILDQNGARNLSLQELIHDHVAGEKGKFILKGILIPPFPPGTWGKFLKAGVRSAIDFALADVAVRYSPAPAQGKSPLIRIILGAVAPEPFYLEETARQLSILGNSTSRADIFASALKEAEAKIAPIRETAVSASTKKQSLLILRRAMQELLSVLSS